MNTKDKLKVLGKFKEQQLTDDVIIPLLEKMKFKNITQTHGPLEKGKDLLFYKENEFEEREYTGVQVKAVNIHGTAGKSGNASEILIQAQQAFTHEFRDIYDNKSKHVDKYMIITSGTVSESAKESVDSQLKALGYYKLINFFDGNKIISLMNKYMPDFFWEEYDCFNHFFQEMKKEFETIADISAIGQKEALRLEEIYVSLKLSDSVEKKDIAAEIENELIFHEEKVSKEKKKVENFKRDRILDPEKAIQQYRHLVITGAPGAGKTTLIKHLALKTCKENLLKEERSIIPIPIILREFSQSGLPLRAYIDEVFDKYGFQKANTFAEKELKAGKVILLLDGFDELAARENQEKVAQQIREFVKQYPTCRVVVTSRTAGYHDQLAGFTCLEVMEFNDSQIKGFITRWFGKPGQDKSQPMLKAVMENENIKALARNPLMVSIIAVIYEEDRELPQRRVELYRRAVEVLLSRWDNSKKLKNKYSADKKEFILKKLAYASHCRNRRVSKEQEILKEIAKHSSRLGLQEGDHKPFLMEIWQRSFLLKQIAVETYDFLHLSFQEYFTALQLREQPQGMDTIIKNLDKPWWEEPILLYAGISKDAGPLIRKIQAEVPEDIFYSSLMLSGKCITDAEFTDPELKEEIIQKLWSPYQEGEFFLHKEKAMKVLRLIKPKGIINLLLKQLKDKDPEVRQNAVLDLGTIGSSEAIEPLAKLLISDSEKIVRMSAAEALGDIGNSRAIEPLINALISDKDSGIRWSALIYLGRFGGEAVIPTLLQLLNDYRGIGDVTLYHGKLYYLKFRDKVLKALYKISRRLGKRITPEDREKASGMGVNHAKNETTDYAD